MVNRHFLASKTYETDKIHVHINAFIIVKVVCEISSCNGEELEKKAEGNTWFYVVSFVLESK